MEADTRTFGERLHAAAKRLRYLQKEGYNDHFKYAYVGEAQVKRAVGDALLAEGLVLGCIDVEVVESVTIMVPTKTGDKPKHRVTLKVSVEVGNAAGGKEYASFTGIGSALDDGDKAAMKAMAAGLKYALTSGFLIATGDDPEADTQTDIDAASNPTPVPDNIEGLREVIPALLKSGRVEELKRAVQAFRNHPEFETLKAACQAAVKEAR